MLTVALKISPTAHRAMLYIVRLVPTLGYHMLTECG